MGWWVIGGVGLFVMAGLAWVARASWRMRVPWGVTPERDRILDGREPAPAGRDDTPALAATFARESLVRAGHFLDAATLEPLVREAVANLPRAVRGFVPTHKQGGTVSYELLHRHAPGCLALYHAPAMHRWVAAVTGLAVTPAGDHDQSACSLLYYTAEGDHINWHHDPNFYHGRQFTVLLTLINRGAKGGAAASVLLRRWPDGREEAVPCGENVLVLFEGTRVLHKVTPAAAGDLRVVLSMTFNTDRRISLPRELARRVKDTAFYGLSVLWD